MAATTFVLLALLVTVLLAMAGHALGRVTRIAEETWWLACGALLGLAGRVLPHDGLHVVDTVATLARDAVWPLFVFAAAYTIDRRNLIYHRTPIVVLPTVGIVLGVLAMSLVALLLPADLPWTAIAALGAVLAATDATAVTAQLAMRAPRGIRVLLNGEAVFAAAAAFTLVDALVVAPAGGPGLLFVPGVLVAFVAGGAIGLGVVRITDEALRHQPPELICHWLVPATGLAAFLAAEAIGASGVAACLIAGYRLPRWPEGALAIPYWTVLARALRALVFLTAGVLAPSLPFADAAVWFLPALVALHAARFAAVFAVTFVIDRLAKFHMRPRERALIATFSTRGAATLAIAFALPAGLPWSGTIQSVALLVVALDLLGIAPATQWLARRFANQLPVAPIRTRKARTPY
jgi:CPA1 family monovalent cation:H+ antiporter